MSKSSRGDAWGNRPKKSQNKAGSSKTNGQVPAKFAEAQSKIQKSLEKHLKEDHSSSEEDELETDTILESLLENYSRFGGKSQDLSRTQNYIENSFHSGAAICVICIGSVKRSDSIWSCESCYGFYHLTCIQRWAKDSINHQKMSAELRGEKLTIVNWQCPKCRKDYAPNLIPNRYLCFCGKVDNPKFHPWLVPHSCGEACNRSLQPKCGHLCLLLCHPGPCPPCPKTVKVPCHCQKGAPKPVRCSQKSWSCSQVCGQLLQCNNHKCREVCHEGPCPPCQEQSLITCNCSSQKKMSPCTELFWQCDKVCGKPLSCNEHKCELVCHRGDCGLCPRTKPRSCPCGKDTALLPCTEEISTCGGTCGKLLDCGLHTCSERCHRGACGACLERSVKRCRCGLHEKETSCQKEYLCETKCKRMRDCNIHPCNRKCCNGQCPICEKICGKTLNCGQHKCTSVCHGGACYPCSQTKKISCRCDATSIVVPCGASKRTAPPKCTKLCKVPPNCHHPEREPHRCHFGDCPPCSLKCLIEQPCGHFCSRKCHSAVLVLADPNFKPATPWEKMNTPVEVRAVPCPPCPVPVPVECPGGHEIIELPCHAAVPRPCGKACGRKLPCTNHTCPLTCHKVVGAANDIEAGTNCEQCTASCIVERSCSHECPLPCHPPPCPPCSINLRFKCHCGILQKFIKCSDLLAASDEARDALLTCGNQCPKNYECGHRCHMTCHSGDCPGSATCRKKVKVTCKCKTIKKDALCYLVSKGESQVACTAKCTSVLLERQEEEKKKKLLQMTEEQKKHQEEVEMFEKKLHGRRRNRRRGLTNDEEEDESFLKKNALFIGGFTVIIFSIVILYYFK